MSSINSDYNYSPNYSNLFANSSSSNNVFSLQQQLNFLPMYNGYGSNGSSLTSDQSSSVIDFKNASNTLQSALSSLFSKKNDGNSIFGTYSAVSSDSNALTADYKKDVDKYSSDALESRRDPNYKSGAPNDLGVKVDQVATTQVNKGAHLKKDEMALDPNKTYQFEIEVGGKTKTVSIKAEYGDNNESIQKKLASAINDSDSGVHAKVITNPDDGTTSLKLESDETGIDDGKARAFTLKDVSGDAVDKLGLNNMTQAAQNAIVEVGDLDENASTDDNTVIKGNARKIESKSNSIELDDRTTINAKKTTDDYVAVKYSADSTDAVNSVRDLVNGFNALMDVSGKNADDNIRSSRLYSQLSNLTKVYDGSLAKVGITTSADGYLQIDEDKMKEAAKNGALENLFNSKDATDNYGFASNIKRIAGTVEDNPTQYVTGASGSQGDPQSIFDEETSSASYSKLYFNLQKYDNIGSLFNSIF